MGKLTVSFLLLPALLLASANPPVAYGDVTSGLFSRYTFETDASDVVGSNDGALTNGASIVSDPERGNVLSLDGSNDYVSLPQNNMARARSEITVTMWIKPDQWASDGMLYDEAGGNYGEWWQFSMSRSTWYTRDTSTGPMGGRNNDLAMPSVPTGQWHHLAFVYSVSEPLKAIYYDGAPYTSASNSVDQLTTDRTGVGIGYTGDSRNSQFGGLVDDVRFYDRALDPSEIEELASPTSYALTANSGTGDGDYIVGAIVPISADAAPPSYGFAAWTGDVGGIDDIYEPDTTIAMPPSDVEITATYGQLYRLTVFSGLGGGDYAFGTAVDIFADAPPADMAFDQWVGDIGGVADVYSDSTTVSIPSSNVSVTATYVTVSGYYLTVRNGTGDGTYPAAGVASITAYLPPAGQDFYEWVGAIAGVAAVNASVTTYTMPSSDASIAAYYRDIGAQTYEVHQDLDEATGRIYRLDDKPYLDLIDQNGFFQPETLIFHDVETGKEVWSLTRESCKDLANIERMPAWSWDGQYISFMSGKVFWDYETSSLRTSTGAGHTFIANADSSKRRKLWAVGPGGLTRYQSKFNSWDRDVHNRAYYPMDNTMWRVTLGPGNNDTDNIAESVYTFGNSAQRIIHDVHDDNWLLIEETGGTPTCHLMNLKKDPSDPYFCMSYPLAGLMHPGGVRFKRSRWVAYGGYEGSGVKIYLEFNETSVWEIPSASPTTMVSGHNWYGPPDDRCGILGSWNSQEGLYLEHPGYSPVRMARVPDGHVTWCGLDPEWFFAAVGPGTTPDIQYERRLLAGNADGVTVEIVCRPWDRSRGAYGGYDKYPRPNQSPDASKSWFHSDMLNSSNDFTGSYIAIFRKPYAPTLLTYSGGEITFTPHTTSREMKSYLLYRYDGQSWQVVQEVSADASAFVVGQDGTYMVTALEWSGIESDTSSQTIAVPGGTTGSPVAGWDTVAPAEPTNLSVVKEAAGRYRLTWDAPADPDLRYFSLYFSSIGNPQALQQRRIVSPPKGTTEYLDWTAPLGGSAYYAVTAVDRQGNESEPAYPGGVTQQLTVTNGSGDGDYEEDEVVSISADPPDSGKLFAGWIGDTSHVADCYQADTTVTMPAWNITVTAIYAWGYTLTVNNGSGDGLYLCDTVVDVQAGPAPTNMQFAEWTGDTSQVADVGAQATTFTMPSYDCEVTATYEPVLPGDLDGSGFVGQGDLDIILDSWGNGEPSPPNDPITDPRADPSGDGFVGQADLDIILDNWGEGG